ncbi:carbohydrate ABC transporter permease [Streptosporangium sp. G11]|uniref:carbohydrate ABC transporter permease n=1 Tax=Streptosporangium sp. G11 TaxID=3436926 RepID=UPI003EBC907D
MPSHGHPSDPDPNPGPDPGPRPATTVTAATAATDPDTDADTDAAPGTPSPTSTPLPLPLPASGGGSGGGGPGGDRDGGGSLGTKGRAGRRWLPWALPAVLLVTVFFLLPFALNARFAFSSWTGFRSEITWNGLDNFRTLVEQGLLTNAVTVTVLYAILCMAIQNTVSLSLALALQRTDRVNTVFRSLFFLPTLVSPLAAGYIWRGILDPAGPVDSFLGIDWAWLGEPATALVTVAFVDAWKWSGLITLVYIAGLNSVPRELLESATVDGAGPWTRFARVRFPLLAPAITFNVAVTLVGALSAYDVIAATTGGGPGDHTRALNIVMRQQWGQGFFGSASALGFTVTLLVIATAVPLVWWLRRREVTG